MSDALDLDAITAALDYLRDGLRALVAEVRRLREEQRLSGTEAERVIRTVIRTIGGTVEGHPTQRINYLQRLRQLVEAEARVRELKSENQTLHEIVNLGHNDDCIFCGLKDRAARDGMED